MSIAANAQQKIEVRGTVTDATDKLTIIGATVLERGTTNGTITDMDGNYKIEVNPQAVLEYSSIGYLTQYIAVNWQTIINVELQRDPEHVCYPDATSNYYLFSRNKNKSTNSKDK